MQKADKNLKINQTDTGSRPAGSLWWRNQNLRQMRN